MSAALRRLAKRDVGQLALTVAILRSGIRAGRDATFVKLPGAVQEILGDEEIRRVVEGLMEGYELAGWRFGFDTSLMNHFTVAISPDGTITQGNALFAWPDVEQVFLELSTANSEEEKQTMRKSEVSSDQLRMYAATYPW